MNIDWECTGILGKHVLLGLSGGADSVALFLLLNELRTDGRIRLTCAHFEHGIRAQSSLDDRDFADALCRRHGVLCLFDSACVPEEARITGEGLETCARRLRYAFFDKAMAACGAEVLALAHHRDDQAETVLMHLLRGGGLSGACGMQAFDGRIARPLLNVPKAQLIRWLQERNQPWREDETNSDVSTPRNMLRNRAFPALEGAYPGAKDALCRFSLIAREENDFMERAARECLKNSVSAFADIYRISAVSGIDTAILRRVIRLLLPKASFADVEKARSVRSSVELSGGVSAFYQEDNVYLVPAHAPWGEILLPEEGECALPGVCSAEIRKCKSVPVRDNGYTQVLDASALSGACLRLRRPGDEIRPFGMGGKKRLLSDVFTDKKIPRPIRDRIPLVAKDGEVLWAAGVAISEGAKVEPDRPARKITIRMRNEIGGDTYEK